MIVFVLKTTDCGLWSEIVHTEICKQLGVDSLDCLKGASFYDKSGVRLFDGCHEVFVNDHDCYVHVNASRLKVPLKIDGTSQRGHFEYGKLGRAKFYKQIRRPLSSNPPPGKFSCAMNRNGGYAGPAHH